MKYRIAEANRTFTPQLKVGFWWINIGCAYHNYETALNQIKNHDKEIKERKDPVYHYISSLD